MPFVLTDHCPEKGCGNLLILRVSSKKEGRRFVGCTAFITKDEGCQYTCEYDEAVQEAGDIHAATIRGLREEHADALLDKDALINELQQRLAQGGIPNGNVGTYRS